MQEKIIISDVSIDKAAAKALHRNQTITSVHAKKIHSAFLFYLKHVRYGIHVHNSSSSLVVLWLTI
jgi:hypothetical protein